MQVKYYNSVNNQWEGASPLPPEEIYIGSTPPAQGINAKLWLDTSVTGLLPASYTVADNCEQTVAGQAALDAHQGYLLQNQINNLSEDFIVEQGTSDIWTYRKWNSGIAECWGITSQSWAMTSTYGSLYYVQSPILALPSNLFTSITSVQAQRGANSGVGLIGVSVNIVTTSYLQFFVYNSKSDTITAGISFYVIGRWK